MKRIRRVGLCLTAMVVFSAAAVASASAHEYMVVGGTLPQEVTGTSGVSKLEGEVLKTKITIECSKDTFTGSIEAGGKSKGEVTFEGCKVVGQATCEVPNIKFKFTDLLVGPVPGVEDEFKPTEPEEVFVVIKINVCALKGSYKVKGTQVCKLPQAGESKVEHEIECTPAGSKLTLGGAPAKFTSTEKVKLKSGLSWSAK